MTMQTELNYKRIIKCINFSFKMRKMVGTQMASMLPNLVFQTVSMLPKHELINLFHNYFKIDHMEVCAQYLD